MPHWDIGTELGILDGERAAKIAGSMFTMYRGWGARLLRAMVQLSLDRNADAYEELRPPTLVRTDTMIATGPPPEVRGRGVPHGARRPLGDPHRRGAAHVAAPRRGARRGRPARCRYTAHTSCFRREAGAAGRDTRGLLRVHEFDKVELLAVANGAEQAIACQEDILARSEALLAELGLPYRILDLCTGDVGASAARTWDIEAYAPGCDMWLEVSSVSWFTDYQARRANIRYRPDRRQGHRGVPHRERLGHGLAAHGGGLPRDAPPARRLDRGREAAAGLPRRRGHHRPSLSRAAALGNVPAGTPRSPTGGTGMQKYWAWLGLNLGKHAGIVSIVGLLITIVLGFGITQLEFATGQDSYLNKDEEVYKDSVAYQDLFGGQAMVTLVTLGEGQELTDLFTPEAVEHVGARSRPRSRSRAATTSSASSPRSPPCSSPTTSCCPPSGNVVEGVAAQILLGATERDPTAGGQGGPQRSPRRRRSPG